MAALAGRRFLGIIYQASPDFWERIFKMEGVDIPSPAPRIFARKVAAVFDRFYESR